MKAVILLAALFVTAQAHAASDPLTRSSVAVPGPHGDETLARTAADLKAVFQRYVPGLDSSSTIVKPLRVTGPADRPVITVSIRKCMAFICQTVDLDAAATLREVRGGCAHNYLLQADLSRSSQQLTDIYDRLDVAGCYKSNADGSGTLTMEASAHQAANYSQGLVQQEIVKMLTLQVGPITKALQDTMKAKNL